MQTPHAARRLLACALGLALGAIALTGCDAAGTNDAPGSLTPSPVTSAPPSGVSAIDGRPIVHLRAADVRSGAYAASIRAALAAHRPAVLEAMVAGRSESGSILVKDLFEHTGADGRTSAAVPSTHVVIVDDGGTFQQYVLRLTLPEGGVDPNARGGGDTYVMMDPPVFHPDPETGEDTYPRTVPATNLDTGEDATVALTETSSEVVGDEDAEIIIVEPIPVIDQINEEDASLNYFGEPRPDSLFAATSSERGVMTLTYLGLRRLRINRSFDGNTKNEVQFTEDPNTDYSLPFAKRNTRRLDDAFWTVQSGHPSGGPGTLNPIRVTSAITLWFDAEDVNYPNRSYNFPRLGYYECRSGSSCGPSNIISQNVDFPLIQLPSSSVTWRGYLNEDDHNVTYFSRRDGEWQGYMNTVNFSSGGFSSMNTRLGANNHAIVSSDQPFTDSGMRNINSQTVAVRTANGTQTFNTDIYGLQYDFSRMTITVNS